MPTITVNAAETDDNGNPQRHPLWKTPEELQAYRARVEDDARKARRRTIALAVLGAVATIVMIASNMWGAGVSYRQMRALETISVRCVR